MQTSRCRDDSSSFSFLRLSSSISGVMIQGPEHPSSIILAASAYLMPALKVITMEASQVFNPHRAARAGIFTVVRTDDSGWISTSTL